MPGETILITEDESIVARDIKSRLVSLGYPAPVIALTGEDAVARARVLKPDLLLMDIILVRGLIDGIEAAKQIRAFLDVPLIYLTASNDKATLARARESSPDGFILKPFETFELKETIERVLNSRSEST